MSSGRAGASPRRGAGDPERIPSVDTSPYRPYVPDLLLDWPAGVRWQALDGTLVSADVSGFTALSERLAALGREGAEELSALICACFEGMIEDCHGVGGDIVKFGGDALLVWFHGPEHERRACRASAAMRRTIRRRRTTSQGRLVRLGVSIGVHAGTHHFFLVDVGMTDVVVTGPGATATVTAEAAAETGEILVSHATAARLPDSWLGAPRDEGVTLARVAGTPTWRHPTRRERRDLAPFVPPDQRELLLAGVLPEHRQVTVTFLGFGGTDAMIAAGHADDVAERLQHVASAVASACETYGVHFLATDVNRDGGKFFMTAGAPTSLGSDEGRMLRAVRDVVDADPGVGLRAGVNRGRVFGADLGSARRRTYTTLGDTTNLAARLMGKAGPGEIVVTRSTLDWAATRFEFDALEPFQVKGKRLPISAVRLGRYLGPRTDLDEARTRLMGRATELAALRAAAERADAGTSQVMLLAGEPGIGKTRLALELLERGGVSAVVRCQPFDRLSAWSVTAPLLRTLLGIDRDAAPAVAGEVLLAWLGQHAPHLVAVSPLLAVAVDAAVPATDVADAVLPEFRRERTLSAVRELLAAGIVEPTTVLVDDVDVADDASRELVELLLRDPIDAPLLVVTTAAPDETLAAPRLDLGPLPVEDVLGMVDDLLGDEAVPPSTVRAVVERAAGNPLFAGELIRVLIDDPAADTPDSLEALVAARIDALDPDDRRLLRSAAVVGPTVDVRLLAGMIDDDIVRERDRWDRLDRFLESVGPGVVRFRFDTYHRVVYGGLSFAARREMHGDLIEVLERDGATRTRDELALLAFHADRAGDRQRAWRYGTAAAHAAADDATFVEAARLFTMALASRHRDVGHDELIAVAERAGDVYEIVGRLDDADRVLALAQRHTADGVARARLWRKRSEVAERVGDLRRAAQLLDRARRQLAAVPWATALREQARLESARSVIALRQSNLEAAWSHATAALSRAELVGDWATAAHAALMVDNCVTNLRWEGIHVQRPDVAALYRRAGDPVGEAKYLSNRATDLYYDGEWSQALELYRTAASMSATHGHTVSEATCLNNIAEILSDQGRLADAATLFRDAGRSWRSVGYGIGLALLAANRGRLATRTGDHAEAQRLLEEARLAFAELGATAYVCEAELRAIDDELVSGGEVAPDRWPGDEQLDAEITLRLYADRLRASTLNDDLTARALLASTAARAASAGLPFEEALAWHAAATRFDDDAARRRAAAIFARLDVHTPPPVPHRHASPTTA